MKNLVIGILATVTVVSVGFSVYFYRELRSTQFPQSLTAMSPNSETGKISGILGYPSDYLPEGTIVAKNVVSGAEFSQAVDVTKANYEFILPAGTYHLKYDIGDGAGYYTAMSECLGNPDCPKDGRLKSVTVENGKMLSGININDFYSVVDPSQF